MMGPCRYSIEGKRVGEEKVFYKPEISGEMIEVKQKKYHEFDGNKGVTSVCVWAYLKVTAEQIKPPQK